MLFAESIFLDIKYINIYFLAYLHYIFIYLKSSWKACWGLLMGPDPPVEKHWSTYCTIRMKEGKYTVCLRRLSNAAQRWPKSIYTESQWRETMHHMLECWLLIHVHKSVTQGFALSELFYFILTLSSSIIKQK